MSHLSEETLAGVALGEPDALSLRGRWHLSWCRRCAGSLTELRQVVTTGRAAHPYPLRPPRPGLLSAIQAELDADDDRGTAIAREPRTSELAAAEPVRSPSGPARSRRTRWLVAAAVVIVGVGATVVYRQASEDVLATAVLTPLPSKSGRGTAEMIRGPGGQELSISITTEPPADRFEEVWLFSSDGRGMISVGIVPTTGKATFPVPSAAGALAGYTVVDVSLEPYDGDPAHSHNSILRGTLS